MVAKNCSTVGQVSIRGSISTLSFERDKGFVGREEIIAEIDNHLLFESRVAVAGIGGVG